jgi:hypothetical protein
MSFRHTPSRSADRCASASRDEIRRAYFSVAQARQTTSSRRTRSSRSRIARELRSYSMTCASMACRSDTACSGERPSVTWLLIW